MRTTYLERLSSEMHGRGSGLVAARGCLHSFFDITLLRILADRDPLATLYYRCGTWFFL
ncbi:hypothetical protein CK203_095235 [Vitis vinifera]|uniref:Uncharacterized protein n=1 Tax=Vitis vinifera TaxID=29760 RepID=A0A438BPW8_VITVI|nr:hypothetical protein CK203_095235 [Vitis vinifera]